MSNNRIYRLTVTAILAALALALSFLEGLLPPLPVPGARLGLANLAVMFAMSSNARVVIVDADIRKGRVAHSFDGKSDPGLSEYLSGQVTLEEVIRKSGLNENLDYISCGTHSPKPFEMLESDVMKELDKLLRERYDYVIYDTSPLLLVSDALAIAP